MTGESHPRISILMPVWNGEHFLRKTLDTVIAQTFKDWELIVMDGGSKDNTVQIVREYASRHPGIRVISEKDEGPYHAIHKALKLARSECIAVLCASDGYLDVRWYERAMDVMKNDPEVSVVWGIPFDMNEQGEVLGPVYTYAHFLQGNMLGRRPSVLKKILGKISFRRPSSILNVMRKMNRANFTATRHMMGSTAVPQKKAWFHYWLKTGTIFPDGNMIVNRRAFTDCLPPYRAGTREPGDWMGFFFNLNARGYLAHCIPQPANFGRIHEGQVSEVVEAYNDKNRREYFANLKAFRRKVEETGFVSFQDRAGNKISGMGAGGSHQQVKLHLGCGEKYLEGYINIDYPTSEHSVMKVRADKYADIRTLSYPENSVDEVRNHHMFEHFTRAEALHLLLEWRKWLKPNGILHIETPDFAACARAYASSVSRKRRFELGRHVFGSQEAKWAIHYDFWDKAKFTFVLRALGFKHIRVRRYANSFAKYYPWIPLANTIGRFIPERVYRTRGGNKLPNIEVVAEKDSTFALDEPKAVRNILAQYLVGREDERLLNVWFKEFERAHGGKEKNDEASRSFS